MSRVTGILPALVAGAVGIAVGKFGSLFSLHLQTGDAQGGTIASPNTIHSHQFISVVNVSYIKTWLFPTYIRFDLASASHGLPYHLVTRFSF